MDTWSSKDRVMSETQMGGWDIDDTMGFDFSSFSEALTSAASSTADRLAEQAQSKVAKKSDEFLNKVLGIKEAPKTVPPQQVVYQVQKPAPPTPPPQTQVLEKPLPKWVLPTALGVGGLISTLLIIKVVKS